MNEFEEWAQAALRASIVAAIGLIGGIARMSHKMANQKTPFSWVWFLGNCFVSFSAAFILGLAMDGSEIGPAWSMGVGGVAGYSGARVLDSLESRLRSEVSDG